MSETPVMPFGHYFRDASGAQHFHTGATVPPFAQSEVTPLYTAPPAAIPVAALRALAAQLASDAACKGLAPGYRSACGHIHNQLTALITAQEHRQ